MIKQNIFKNTEKTKRLKQKKRKSYYKHLNPKIPGENKHLLPIFSYDKHKVRKSSQTSYKHLSIRNQIL